MTSSDGSVLDAGTAKEPTAQPASGPPTSAPPSPTSVGASKSRNDNSLDDLPDSQAKQPAIINIAPVTSAPSSEVWWQRWSVDPPVVVGACLVLPSVAVCIVFICALFLPTKTEIPPLVLGYDDSDLSDWCPHPIAHGGRVREKVIGPSTKVLDVVTSFVDVKNIEPYKLKTFAIVVPKKFLKSGLLMVSATFTQQAVVCFDPAVDTIVMLKNVSTDMMKVFGLMGVHRCDDLKGRGEFKKVYKRGLFLEELMVIFEEPPPRLKAGKCDRVKGAIECRFRLSVEMDLTPFPYPEDAATTMYQVFHQPVIGPDRYRLRTDCWVLIQWWRLLCRRKPLDETDHNTSEPCPPSS